jgi:hypothetical protein
MGSPDTSHPIRRIRSCCCARAGSGHVAAAPPRNDMNSRRLMGFFPEPRSQTVDKPSLRGVIDYHEGNWDRRGRRFLAAQRPISDIAAISQTPHAWRAIDQPAVPLQLRHYQSARSDQKYRPGTPGSVAGVARRADIAVVGCGDTCIFLRLARPQFYGNLIYQRLDWLKSRVGIGDQPISLRL